MLLHFIIKKAYSIISLNKSMLNTPYFSLYSIYLSLKLLLSANH